MAEKEPKGQWLVAHKRIFLLPAGQLGVWTNPAIGYAKLPVYKRANGHEKPNNFLTAILTARNGSLTRRLVSEKGQSYRLGVSPTGDERFFGKIVRLAPDL